MGCQTQYSQGQEVLMDAYREDLELFNEIMDLIESEAGGEIEIQGRTVRVEPKRSHSRFIAAV